MKKYITLTYSLLCTFMLALQPSFAEKSILDHIGDTLPDSKDFAVVPYAFSTDPTGFASGIGVIKQGLFQPQTVGVTSLFYGTKQDVITNGKADTASFSGGFFGIFDYRIPETERLFASTVVFKSYFPKAKYYLYNHTINSDKESYIESAGDMDYMYATLRYVLPVAEGLDNPERHYHLKNGFPVGREGFGGGAPFITGRTSVGINAFYEHNSFDNFLPGTPRSSNGVRSWNTNGLRFFIEHENTDFNLNPSRGYQFKLQYSKDYGWADSDQSWDFLEFKYNHYISLPTLSFTQQNVLAMSFWTGHSFSWDKENEYLPGIAAHRPPPWEGARLGGMFHMRGYNFNRFSDKSVIYGTAEYRAVLKWNPFRDIGYLPFAIDWLQAVGFAEVGSVNHTYNADLLTDLKYDVGLSLRAMAAQVPIRFDIAYSDEGVNMWVMVFQPFDF